MSERAQEFSAEREGITWKSTPFEDIRCDYGKYFYTDAQTGVLQKETLYPRGVVTPWHRHTCAHGMYVLDGRLYTDQGEYGPGHFLWWPAGSVAEHGAVADDDARVFFMTTSTFDLLFENGPDQAKESQGLKEYAVDVNALQWAEKTDFNGGTYLEKTLLDDPVTGMQVALRRLPAGWETPWHSAECSIGCYVLKGMFKSDRGYYGPGSFVMFPEGCISRKGASHYTFADVITVADKKEADRREWDPSNWDRA